MIVAVQTYARALQKKIRGRMHIKSWAGFSLLHAMAHAMECVHAVLEHRYHRREYWI